MKKKLNYQFFPSKEKAKKALVAIHGWKGNRESMMPLVKSLNFSNIDWYLLEAPYLINNKENSYSWSYEISKDKWEVEEPRLLLYQFFTILFEKYSSKDIYVLGFSQGGLICIDFVLFLDRTLGGVFPIAGFSRSLKSIKPRIHPCQISVPILISHGKEDDVVPATSSIIIYDQLQSQGANVELFLYTGKHKIGIECLRKIKKIILS